MHRVGNLASITPCYEYNKKVLNMDVFVRFKTIHGKYQIAHTSIDIAIRPKNDAAHATFDLQLQKCGFGI